MTDAEDKTGRHRNWADKIPLVAVLAVVALVAGGLVEAKFTRKAIDDLSTTLKDAVKEQKQFNVSIDTRQTADEIWRAAHEAAREERKRR